MSSLFGVELPTPVNFIIAFVFVLLLIGAAAWLVRRFGATRIDAAARGRQPRLAVIDSAAVDGRRKLVIIRRDNVEHLLMIGGPSDVVVETNIVRGTAVADPRCASRRETALAETMPRAMPQCPNRRRGRCSPSPRPPRRRSSSRRVRNARAAADEVWQTPPAEPAVMPPPVPEVRPVRPADTLAGLADELARPSRAAATRPVQVQPPASIQPARVRRRRSRSRPPARRSRARPPTRASPKWRSASKPRSAARWRRRWSPKPSESRPLSKSKRAPRRLPCSRAAPHPGHRAISNKRWRVF